LLAKSRNLGAQPEQFPQLVLRQGLRLTRVGDQVRQPLVFCGQFAHLVQLLPEALVLLFQPQPRLVSKAQPNRHPADCSGAKDG